jgi:UDP:flavonoid glycosyltransferase YjiC (YdhE family)
MRILFVSFPGLGHFFPIVPLAWAARTAGHEVLVATAGPALPASRDAGLPTIDCARGVDVMANLASGVAVARGLPDSERIKHVARGMAHINDAMADALLDAARRFRPTAIVSTPLSVVGELVAAALDVPLFIHGLGLTIGGRSPIEELIPQLLGETAARLGVSGRAKPFAHLDACPPSMSVKELPGAWPMRLLPYNGGAIVPDWVLRGGPRNRVCITLGSVIPKVQGTGAVGALVEAAQDQEVILALGDDVDPASLGPMPANVRVAPWVPFSVLAPTCRVIVHHGGSGTTLNALAAGAAQLIVPHFADQPANAAAVERRGMGLTLRLDEVTAARAGDALRRLLSEASFGRAASELVTELEAMPAPPAIVARMQAALS